MRSPLDSVRLDCGINRISVSHGNRPILAVPLDNGHMKLYDLTGSRLAQLPRQRQVCVVWACVVRCVRVCVCEVGCGWVYGWMFVGGVGMGMGMGVGVRVMLRSLQVHRRMVCSVAWSHDSHMTTERCNLFSAGFDNKVVGWKVKF